MHNGNMFALLSLLITLLRFSLADALKLCQSEADCVKEGMTCVQVSNINCSCFLQEINLKKCVGESLLKAVDLTMNADVELRPQELRDRGPKIEDDPVRRAKKTKDLKHCRSPDIKDTTFVSSPIHIMGLSLAVFIGISLLFCLCCVACTAGAAALYYYSRNGDA